MFAPKMMGVCLRYTHNREDAEDFLQDGFIRIFEKIDTFRFQGSFEGWMRRIIVNMIIESFRRNKKNTDIIEEFPDEQSFSNEETDTQDTPSLDVLLKMVQQLPPGYRMVFNLYVLEGLSHEEIAQKLNISTGSSKSNLSRAKRWLQEKLRDYNKNDSIRTSS